MTPQLATKASPSDSVTGMNMVIIMSGAPRLDRMTSAQATAAIRSRLIEVTTAARSRTGARGSRDAGMWRSAETMGAVYVGRRGTATFAAAPGGFYRVHGGAWSRERLQRPRVEVMPPNAKRSLFRPTR